MVDTPEERPTKWIHHFLVSLLTLMVGYIEADKDAYDPRMKKDGIL